MKILKKGIYKFNRVKDSIVSKNVLKFLENDASEIDRFRSRILYHDNSISNPQHMLICFDDRSVVPVSFHEFAESFSIIKGIAHYKFYDLKGNVKHDIRLSPAYLDGTFYVAIARLTPHRFFSITKHVLANEIGFTHFSPDLTKFGKGKTFLNADKLTTKQMLSTPLVYGSETKFNLIKKNSFSFGSNNGIAQLSTKDVTERLKNSENAISFMADEKIIGKKYKKKIPEVIWAIKPGKKIDIKLNNKNSIIHIMNGVGLFNLGNKKVILDINKNFALNTLENKNINVKNLSENNLIIHISNDFKFINQKI